MKKYMAQNTTMCLPTSPEKVRRGRGKLGRLYAPVCAASRRNLEGIRNGRLDKSIPTEKMYLRGTSCSKNRPKVVNKIAQMANFRRVRTESGKTTNTLFR